MNNYYVAMRQEAIKRYYQGEHPKQIYMSLGRSKKWFFKWLERQRKSEPKWYLDKGRARKTQVYALPGYVENAIVKKRLELEGAKYQQIGACKIRMELKKASIAPLPHAWQINRVLKRNDLVHPKGPYKSKGKLYPSFTANKPGVIHQADYARTRKIQGEGFIRTLNNIDVYSRKACVNIIRTKQAKATMGAFISTWKRMGIPQYLQLDNDPVFETGSYFERLLSRVLKLALSLNIEPIFIPVREPWRNSYIEKFNSTYKHVFFNSQRWDDIGHIRKESRVFEEIRDETYCLSVHNGLTPNEVISNHSINYLPGDYKIPKKLLLPKKGKIHFIRFIRSDRKMRVLADEFELRGDVVYEYIKATLDIKEQALFIYYQDEIIQSFNYKTQPKTDVYISGLKKSESHLCGATSF